ncbi:RagB/SusD family nutrient uptake outer membrane protein [Pontibacter diazotrophicus]|uniref:RagB/SusD family nutrient uptake outer membrane protein n=1 Tax=Pontibacter diazotrophicus TaxID=1400979 RepID=A0A3D8L7U4_9BACT|nr:RagB/SusD family nutrient uptake outer membrane protein [Pontibacter diazotrophicus]RDV13491.1 RagB/SusD family nutrient uptake outer membrane protein [Pontibacter diazotrophicus]
MRKYIKIFVCACVGLPAITACDDSFLDEEVLSSYSPTTLRDLPGLEASLIGLYNHNSTFYSVSGQQGWPSVWQVGTDVAWPIQPQGVEVPYYDYNTLTPLDGAADITWNWSYTMINNANVIIQNVESPDLTGVPDTEKDRINAEARFFRGLAYNTLATAFGGVPLVTEPLTAPKTDFVRAPLEDVNNQILTDLQFAAENLPDINDIPAARQARANKYMANQLLAEVYLRIGEPAQAEEQANIVINSGAFSLVTERYGVMANQPGDPFSDMFKFGNQRRRQGNTEAIWVMEAENPRDVPGGMTGAPQQRRNWQASYHSRPGLIPADSLGGRGIARLRLNNWVLYNLYDEGDMRNSQHNIRRDYWYNDPDPKYSDIYKTKVPYETADTLFIINPYTTKWGHFDPQDVFGFGMWKDFILMRLGETYLLRAEAQFMQGKLAEAAESINMLRERADAPLVSAADINLDFILDERARELIGEENRRFTLMRTGTLVERANRLNTSIPGLPENRQITGLSEMHLLMPIPQNEIDLNKDAVLDQNPGY